MNYNRVLDTFPIVAKDCRVKVTIQGVPITSWPKNCRNLTGKNRMWTSTHWNLTSNTWRIFTKKHLPTNVGIITKKQWWNLLISSILSCLAGSSHHFPHGPHGSHGNLIDLIPFSLLNLTTIWKICLYIYIYICMFPIDF